ncbi:4-(cytidine 5'-diphospho)-2-C-methyl-D-erythritol kinase [Corynebacterium epidermidicanis]|uniref:4-diphosphocytidyl-2-C-methyl-D-erythritol kinase n=1 Tax=Corynebacterium epidermidicanis TaxID=1050174 RepID=A0A0G3GQ65_9CORY|nr:4-(cytidine 5'-diphospho)-2-C-methyl-D-erythritol kinase [Corynebacterium epidermidicanis]AKK02695.1 4-diphosphocytidyl-2-C-methyl-D-erythritol kinase [Corynebacterium epidermidicanis]
MLLARAHAKVNLHLGVGKARADGFHELRTIFQSLSLFDELSLSTTLAESHELTVSGLGADQVPTDGSNLVWRALDAVAQAAGVTEHCAVQLTKGIPTAGGMAGGSADAAAALRLANMQLGQPLSEEQLLAIAADLGSDVPFTLLGETMIGTGRGEQLVPTECAATLHWALAFQDQGLSTPAVFATLDKMREEDSQLIPSLDTSAVEKALAVGDVAGLAGLLANDLQAPALALLPRLADTLACGEEAGALRGIVSGSGPTCAFLCESAESAEDVAAAILGAGVASGTAVATGPAPGAHLL